MKRFFAFLSIGCLAFVVTLSAENWPAWRGPLANGVSSEKGLPVKWSTQENIAWKLPLPSRSGATPIIWGDHIFLNVATALSTGDLELWAVDRRKGELLWKRPLSGGNVKLQKQNMSTPSPPRGYSRQTFLCNVSVSASSSVVTSLRKRHWPMGAGTAARRTVSAASNPVATFSNCPANTSGG